MKSISQPAIPSTFRCCCFILRRRIFSSDEIAAIENVPMGTIKIRAFITPNRP